MDYARKVIYNGNIVDVEDIVCPGTELAHLSVGNLKKRMNEFVKILNEFRVQIKNIENNIKDEFDLIKATIEQNAKNYETIVTTRLNSEKTKYDALYNHATKLVSDTATGLNTLNTQYADLDEDVTTIKGDIESHVELFRLNTLISATLADQIINIKKQINTLILWKNSLYEAITDSSKINALKEFNTNINSQIINHNENELKYDNIANLTEEWDEYLTEHHPNNKED